MFEDNRAWLVEHWATMEPRGPDPTPAAGAMVPFWALAELPAEHRELPLLSVGELVGIQTLGQELVLQLARPTRSDLGVPDVQARILEQWPEADLTEMVAQARPDEAILPTDGIIYCRADPNLFYGLDLGDVILFSAVPVAHGWSLTQAGESMSLTYVLGVEWSRLYQASALAPTGGE